VDGTRKPPVSYRLPSMEAAIRSKPNAFGAWSKKTMSVEVLIERRDKANEVAQIDLGEWTEILEADPQLRTRTEPYKAISPKTREELVMPVPEGSSEIYVDGKWLPFLTFSHGTLSIRYKPEFEDRANALRNKVVQIARHLGAVVTSDAGDDVLGW
jgi:hypothetical protein